MAVTYKLLETFDGTRTNERADPDNPGKTISETVSNILDIEVEFKSDDPDVTHVRWVNVVFDKDGKYDDAATKERCVEVAEGVKHKIAIGVIQ
tara:strand:+ start:279 stop:557 length:279 start_codon:yes stop_codon:yes gene_type:complete